MSVSGMRQSSRLLASDNAAGVHPKVMAALQEANHGHQVGYGNDPYSERAGMLFKEVFGPQAEAWLLFTGTGANVLALKGMLHSYQAVYCAAQAHLRVDECAAVEGLVGCQLLNMPTRQGKLDPAQLEAHLQGVKGGVHHAQPRVVSIAQATERGTVYRLDELRVLVAMARRQGLWVHMDGSRIANAAVSLDISFKQMTTDLGIDVVSFGGTKNGLMMAEALVVLTPDLAEAYPFIRKQGMQLASKHRFLAAQYIAYFTDELWRENATHANAMARRLAAELDAFDDISVVESVDANLVFARVPQAWIAPLQRVSACTDWDAESSEIRLVTSFDTAQEEIDILLEEVQRLSRMAGR